MQISLGEELTGRLKTGADSPASSLCPLGFFCHWYYTLAFRKGPLGLFLMHVTEIPLKLASNKKGIDRLV